MIRRSGCLIVAVTVICTTIPLHAAKPFRYPEARSGKGELRYINGLPVVKLAGSPEEIGTQMALLTAKPAVRLLHYPKDYLRRVGLISTWPAIVSTGKGMLKNFPADHRKELECGVKAGKLDMDLFVAANTMFDIKKIIACSALIVEPEKSATGGLLFGRNLDFATLGYLHEYSLVVVCRPKGKHAFAAVGFPGLIGVLSGMNDAGLSLAVLEVYSAKDDSLRFDARGTPYALCFRRLLEECTTVAEAEKLLRSMKRTTRLNLAICDKKTGAIFEVTPKNLVVRTAKDGFCPCTNHFRTKTLATGLNCRRFALLEKVKGMPRLGISDVAKKMHEVRQGPLTMQTMVFEPSEQKLHLAIGKPPSSALPLKTLKLGPLLAKP